MIIWKVETVSGKVKFIREVRFNITSDKTMFAGLSIACGSIGPRGGWQNSYGVGFSVAEWDTIHEIVETLRTGIGSGLYKEFVVPVSMTPLLTCTKCTENIDARYVLDHENTPKHKEG